MSHSAGISPIKRQHTYVWFGFTFVAMLLMSAFSVEARTTSIPEPLQPWRDWVLHDYDYIDCPFLYQSQSYDCIWVNSTNLNAQEDGAEFTLNVELFAERWVTLPGSEEYWPLNVMQRVRGQNTALPVRANEGKPQARLAPGKYEVTGRIRWAAIPANLPVPANSGLITLKVQGNTVAKPEIDNSGQLWLKKSVAENKSEERDSQKIQVFRLLRDDNPATLITRVILDISGAPREIEAGEILLQNFEPLSLTSELPARIENNKNLRVQVKPGRWQIELVARHVGPLNSLAYNATSELWPQNEIWAFAANRALRTVQLEGGQSVDPRQTNLPAEWADFPAYRLDAGQAFNLYEVHRGDPQPEADALTISKRIFLDFDGSGYTFSDEIKGQINESWRLDTAGKYQLGNASLDGQPQLITYSPEDHAEGLEIRQGQIHLQAAGRHPFKSAIHVSGWQKDFDQVNAEIFLPPGWSLFATVGIDKVRHSWLSKWSLLDIFLVLIIVVAVFRLCSLLPAALSLVTLLLLYHRVDAPVLIWLNIVGVIALMQVAKRPVEKSSDEESEEVTQQDKINKLYVWLRRYLILSFVFLLILFLPFSVQQVREAIYPQLEPSTYYNFFDQQPAGMYSPAPELKQSELPVPSIVSTEDAVEEIVVTGQKREVGEGEVEYDNFSSAMNEADSRVKRKLSSYSARQEFDPNAVVQTGPGLPTWRWKTATLAWSGPVAESEKMKLFFAPPWLNRVGNVLAVVASILLALLLLQRSGLYNPLRVYPARFLQSAAMIAVLGVLFPTESVHADVVIDEMLLDELQERLLQPPECAPVCASIAQANIEAKDSSVTIELDVDVLDDVAFALPAWRQNWLPQSVNLIQQNKKVPATVKLNGNGQVLVRLTSGRHRLRMSGVLYGERVELPFGMPVHNIELNLDGWEVNGVKDGFAKTGSVQLLRIKKNMEVRDVLLPDPIPPFVKIKRKLILGLEWNVVTTVSRVAPLKGALNVKIPLLQGESPITDVNVEERLVTVDFSPQQHVVQWKSILQKQDVISLKAEKNIHWSEIWALDASPIWHIQYEGIAPIKQGNALHLPVWQPWPGEEVAISVERPAAVEGKSLTIDSVTIDHNLGLRSNTTDVSFNVRTSRGQDFSFNLPEGAEFESLYIDNQTQPLRQLSNKIEIPLRPGEQFIQIKWRSDTGITTFAKIPEINFEEEINNIQIRMNLPYERWPLFVGGPVLGPAVLIWGILVVVALVALVLAKIPLTPLRFHDWLLLGIGIVSTNVFTPVFVAGWFFALGWRGKYLPNITQAQFHFLQVILILLSFLALLTLLGTIPAGLLSHPDMHVVGNNSSAYALQWYQDRSNGLVEQAWVLSFPLVVYRLAMLCWSLWLAVALLRWLKWAWIQLNTGGFWQYEFARKSTSEKAKAHDKPTSNG